VSKDRRRSIRAWIFGGSVALHAAFAVAAVLIPKPERGETAAIELADISKLRKKEPPKPPPPVPPPPPPEKPKPPPPPPKAQAQAKVAAEAPKAEAPPPLPVGEDGFADLGGVALGNGAGGGGGLALGGLAGPGAAAGPAGAAPVAARGPTSTKKVVQQLAPAAADVCNDPPVRPRRKVPMAPKYTMQARQAEIEGVVRVEVTVDEAGRVIAARVLSGLGYGLDEAALAAAKASVFEPASRCGRAVVGTVVLPFRFEST
jgi:protein TonB